MSFFFNGINHLLSYKIFYTEKSNLIDRNSAVDVDVSEIQQI